MRSVVFLLIVLPAIAMARNGDLPDGAILALPSQGYDLTHQCSGGKYQADKYWIPDSIRVIILEARLTTYLQHHPMKTAIGVSLLPLSKWHRQYIGFTRFGRKYIFGVFYPPPDPHSSYDDGVPFNECDAGRSWDVVFDDVRATIKAVDLAGCLCGVPPTTPPRGSNGYFPLPTSRSQGSPERIISRTSDSGR